MEGGFVVVGVEVGLEDDGPIRELERKKTTKSWKHRGAELSVEISEQVEGKVGFLDGWWLVEMRVEL